MKKYDNEIEVYWEVNFFDTTQKLHDFYGNTEIEGYVEILKEKAIKKGYDVVEVIKITREIERYKKKN